MNEILDFLKAEEYRTQGEWSFSPQDGPNRHCLAAQVWCDKEESVAVVDGDDADSATSNATFIAASSRIAAPIRQLIIDYAKAVEALEKSDELIEKAQDIMRSNIVPSGVGNKDAIADYIRLLDNVYQRDVQNKTYDAIRIAELHKELFEGVK